MPAPAICTTTTQGQTPSAKDAIIAAKHAQPGPPQPASPVLMPNTDISMPPSASAKPSSTTMEPSNCVSPVYITASPAWTPPPARPATQPSSASSTPTWPPTSAVVSNTTSNTTVPAKNAYTPVIPAIPLQPASPAIAPPITEFTMAVPYSAIASQVGTIILSTEPVWYACPSAIPAQMLLPAPPAMPADSEHWPRQICAHV